MLDLPGKSAFFARVTLIFAPCRPIWWVKVHIFAHVTPIFLPCRPDLVSKSACFCPLYSYFHFLRTDMPGEICIFVQNTLAFTPHGLIWWRKCVFYLKHSDFWPCGRNLPGVSVCFYSRYFDFYGSQAWFLEKKCGFLFKTLLFLSLAAWFAGRRCVFLLKVLWFLCFFDWIRGRECVFVGFFLRAFGALFRLGLFMQAILHIMHIFFVFLLRKLVFSYDLRYFCVFFLHIFVNITIF